MGAGADPDPGAGLVVQRITMPGGELRLAQPGESAELPDAGGVEWAPVAPYWSVLWRSGVALARELDTPRMAGLRVVELGCGLGLPSLVAARAGAEVLATDASAEAIELLRRNAAANGVELEAAVVDWARPGALLRRAPFDLALAADVLYEPRSAGAAVRLLLRLAPELLLADPGRPGTAELLERADLGIAETRTRGVVRIHRLIPLAPTAPPTGAG